MLISTKALVLSAIKYQDKSLIVCCFTLSNGKKSYFIPNAFSSKKNNKKIAFFQPLTFLEVEVFHKNKGTLEQIKEFKIYQNFNSISTNIYKTSIAIFIAEILQYALHEEQNESLFFFLENSILWLENQQVSANFHITFLIELTKYLGFYPNIEYVDFEYFDLQEGIFCNKFNENTLSVNQTLLFKKALKLDFKTLELLFSGSERQQILKIILHYFSFHVANFKNPKSLEVFQEVFE